MTREEVLKILQNAGNRIDHSQMYTDAFLEWHQATKNIDEHGSIVFHPRTGAPIENPYLKIRDQATKKMLSLKFVKIGDLWEKTSK